MKYYIILEDGMFCNETELRLTESQMIDLGYSIIEVDKEDCCFEDFDENGFNVDKYNTRKTLETTSKTIAQLKQNLANTDYQAIKFAEGRMTAEEYAPIGEQRQQWRDEINRLEVQDVNE